MSANDTQVGGIHYKADYQHWDFVCDTDMPYLLGCATKYVARWQDKAGVEDLNKAIHYLEKATERDVYLHNYNLDAAARFFSSLPAEEGTIIRAICQGMYDHAITLIHILVSDALSGPGPNYINPDNYTRG